MPMPRLLPCIAIPMLVGLAACAGDGPVAGEQPPPPPPPPPAPQVGSWRLIVADGQALPAVVAHRQFEGAYEEVRVDSARLEIHSTGSWSQRIWLRSFRDGALVRRDTWVDAGTMRIEGDTWRFVSDGGSRALAVDTRRPTRLGIVESMASWPNAGLVVGEYQPVPPAVDPGPGPGPVPPVSVTWRAADVRGNAVPAIAYEILDEPWVGAGTQFIVDSARVVFASDGRYEKRVWYSEWQSPNVAYSFGWTRMRRGFDFDVGSWRREGDEVLLESAYWQNRTARGRFVGIERFELTTGLTAGDPPFTIGHTRMP